MGYKFKDKTIEGWLTKGNTQMLAQHWARPEMQAYRKSKLAKKDFYKDPLFNDWCVMNNGATLAYLVANDPEVHKAWRGLQSVEKWSEAFFKRCWTASWALLDLAPQDLRKANGPEVLDLLVRAGHCKEGLYMNDGETHAKLYEEVLGFYRRFQQRGALVAIAGFDNTNVWSKQPAMMANLMRHAATHDPSDVLGAYIVWACDAVHDTRRERNDKEGTNANALFNTLQMQRLASLAERVGLDTSRFQEHAEQCKKLHDGLGLVLNGTNILTYAQSVNTPAAPLLDGDDVGFLFS